MCDMFLVLNYPRQARDSLAPLSSGGDDLTDQNDNATEARVHLAAHSDRVR